MKLSTHQLDLIKIFQASINSNKAELSHAQGKMDAFVSGLLSSKGIDTKCTYEIKGDELVLTFPEPPPIIEE